MFLSRFLRTDAGIEFSPHVCSVAAAILFFWLQSRFPTGEVELKAADDDRT